LSDTQIGITTSMVAGWDAVRMTSDALDVTVLPGKGADIYALIDRASGVDALFKAPWGLRPPGSPPREGSNGAAFLANYEGGWQELFPNTNDACDYRGSPMPIHGEVATLPWSWEPVASGRGEVAARFSAKTRVAPFAIERVMRLRAGERRLVVDERIVNTSAEPAPFLWGHHCVLGPPLVAAGAWLRVPCRTVITPPEPWENTARLAPGQRGDWPSAAGRDGSAVDLSVVPGPEAASHDDVFLTGLEAGRAEVVNNGLGLSFRLEWDPAVFRWVISWQPYGGARAMPLRGAYALGIEPWTTGGNLDAALAAGDAPELDGHGELQTTVTVSFADA
jgi:galactose mutarotase-like enzyme